MREDGVYRIRGADGESGPAARARPEVSVWGPRDGVISPLAPAKR
jgi:hypothetical protein